MAQWHKLIAMTPDERRWLAEAAARLLWARVLLLLLPFGAVMKTLAREDGRPAPVQTVKQVRWAVETAARHLSLTCVPQALAAAWMLKARGHGARLFYGVAADHGAFRSHAWIEQAGTAVIGRPDDGEFTVLTIYPKPSP